MVLGADSTSVYHVLKSMYKDDHSLSAHFRYLISSRTFNIFSCSSPTFHRLRKTVHKVKQALKAVMFRSNVVIQGLATGIYIGFAAANPLFSTPNEGYVPVQRPSM
jgi:transposase